jgi:citrate lyase subunit beta/citryl-CoA lyase
MTHPLRSLLFVPGNHPRKLAKVFAAGADAVILDLEDAVAIAEKIATRPAVTAALKSERRCLAFIRVNAMTTEFCYGDLAAIVGKGLDGIVLPKIEAPWQLKAADWLIGALERAAGLTQGGIDLVPIIETGAGVAAVREIAASGTRVKRLAFGAGDYSVDMNLPWTRDEAEMAHARASIAVASRAAGLEPPLDTVFADLRDREGFAASARRALAAGFQGKMCIHPEQVPQANEVFTPSDAELARARKIVAAFAAAEAAGSASIQLDGQFIDYPIVERARRVLAAMARIEAAGSSTRETP